MSRCLVRFAAISLCVLALTGIAQGDEEEQTESLLAGLKSIAPRDTSAVEVQIARNLLEVNNGRMTAQEFYRRLGQMQMPAHMEQRHLLNKVKKDIFDSGGNAGLIHFFGAQFPEGGSSVEKFLLQWRRNLVVDSIREVMQKFRGRNVRGKEKFSVFLAEIGSWTRETPEAMKFAGDIDFSFVSGDLELATELKTAFAEIVFRETGLTPEGLDAVCTAHGMATEEVYVGKHGQSFGEDAMMKSELIILDFENGIMTDQRLPGKEVLKQVVLEARLAKVKLTDIITAKWPTEPGISLEMIRHFEHDIIKKNIYGDVDSFLKAVKYLDRSSVARYGKTVVPPDPLSQFGVVLSGMKESGSSPADMAAFILRHFQEATGKPFPEVNLGPANSEGLSKVELADREGAIRIFWEQCRSKMWENAMHGFQAKQSELKKAMNSATKETAKAVYDEVAKLREMMEVETRVLTDPDVGVDNLPAEYTKLLDDLRSEYKAFVRKFPEVGGNEAIANLKFIDEMLKARKPSSVKLAWAAIVESPHVVNNFLDVIDDTLLAELRGAEKWDDYLQKQKELHWAKKGEALTGVNLKSAALEQQQVSHRSRIMAVLNKDLSGIFSNALAARIQNTNRILGQGIQSSAITRGTITAMTTFNLKEEIPTYIRLFYSGAAEGNWDALATEIFRRRIPFGSVVENYTMGNYYLALWDFCATLVPPISMARVAVSIAQAVAEWGFQFWYSSELELFIDTLYADATFQLGEVSRINDNIALGKWKLVKVTYRGKEIVTDEYLNTKEKQIAEMLQSLRAPFGQRNFPYDYDAFDPITGWTQGNDLLQQNLRNTDEALLVLDELRNDPIAGEKLKDNYYDFYLTRWAQVKLNFMIQTIRRLEERRAAEQALVSGQVPQLLQELECASAELVVAKEVSANLERETGGIFWQFVLWLRDGIVGNKRAFLAQPDIEDSLEQGARVLIKYAETYTSILEARTNAERSFALGAPIDQGLRLLTGGHFLEGNASADQPAYRSWAVLPQIKRTAVETELSNIKRKYIPGAVLEQAAGSFDRNTLDLVSSHDVWREMWKHVNSQGISAEPGFWEIMQNYRLAAAEQEGSGPDPAERHGYHTAQRDELIALFDEHYRTRQQVQGAAVPQSEEDKQKKQQSCAQLKKDAAQINARLTSIDTRLEEIRVTVTSLQKLISELTLREKECATSAAQAEQSAQKVVASKQQLDDAALSICRSLQQLRQSDTSQEKARLSAEIDKLLRSAEQLNTSAVQEYANASKSAEKAESNSDAAQNLPEKIQLLEEQLAELKKELIDLGAGLSAAESGVTAIPGAGAGQQSLADCDSEAREAAGEAAEGIVILTSKLEELETFIPSGSETDLTTRADRMGDLARDARASADTAEIFIEGLSTILDDARSCGRIAQDPIPQDSAVDKVFFVVRIEGSGFTPTWAGDSYAMSGFEETVFRLRKGEDLAAILQGHRKNLMRNVCDMHTPPPTIHKDAAPVIWQTGPKMTVTHGPIMSEADAFTWKTARQWKLTDEHAPGLQAIREVAGCD